MSDSLSSNTFRMALVALERSGFDAASILEECGLSGKMISNVWARIPVEKERAFWKLVSETSKDPQIGLTLGQLVPFGTFPLLEYVGASCPSVLHALHLLTKYSKIVYGPWNPELDKERDRIEFRLGAEAEPELCRHTTEFAFTVLWERLKDFAATGLSLKEVRFRHAQRTDLGHYRRIFGERVLFEASEDVLVFPSSLGEIECKNSNPLALGSLIAGVDSLFGRLTSQSGGTDIIQSVRVEIERMVSEGEISADSIAVRLGLSKRTLQRKLEREGRSMRALVSEVRRDIATRLLRETEETVEEIALRVGYSDLKAFSRAFAEWYGMSPTAFRRSQKGPDSEMRPQ